MTDAKALVRVGVVSAVKADEALARVYYPDMGDMVSDWLHILRHPGLAVTNTMAPSHAHGDSPAAGAHTHEAAVVPWTPQVDDTVLVLHLPGHDMDGFILGVIA